MTNSIYLECVEDGASKFWSGTVNGKVLTTRWGKISTRGQSKEETFADVAAAKASLDKQAAAKTKKGYTAAAGASAAAPTPTDSSPRAAKATPAAAKASKPRSAPTKSPMPTTKPLLTAWLKDTSRTGAELAAAEGLFPETDRLIAAHTLALPETLSKLSHSSDKATRAKVAANPNTPTSDYVRLGQQFPKEFSANPLLDLLLLENPALLSDIPGALLVQIAKKPECPDDFLVWAAAHADEHVQLAVAMNPKAPEAALASLRQSVHAKVRESVSSVGAPLEGDPEMLFREAVRERLAALTPEEAHEAWSKKYIGVPQFRELSPIARLRVADVATPKMAKLLANALSTQKEPIAESAFLSFIGKEPNKTALSRHLLGTVLALGAGPFVEPARIARLAASTEWLVRAAVARNSGTPPNILKKLSGDPHSVVRALAAANADLAESRSGAERVQPGTTLVFDHLRITQELQKLLKGRDGLDQRKTFALDTNTPVAVLEALAKDEEKDVRSWVVSNPSTPIPLLAALAKDKEQFIRSSVARNPSTPVAVLEALAKDKHWMVLDSVAQNPSTPVALLEALARGPARSSVAENPSTPIALLEALAQDDDRHVRSSVAGNPNTPIALLEVLAQDDDRHVRSSVAGNPDTPIALLEALAQDDDRHVRSSVAGNPSTPLHLRAELLEALAQDDDRHVRSAVAGNPDAPIALLEALAKDTELDVRRSVASNPNAPVAMLESLLEALAKEDVREVRDSVAQNRNTPVAVLEALAKDKYLWVRSLVAQNRNTPIALLEALANDEHQYVRRSVVGNRNTPVAVLEALAKDKDEKVRDAVARNPNTPVAVLEAFAKDKDENVRDSVVRNSNTPVAVLEALAQDEALDVRSSVARNLNTPVAVLAALARDDALDVRSAVARNPNTPAAVLAALREEEARLVSEALSMLSPHEKPVLPEASICRWLQQLTDFPATPDNKALTKASRSKNWLIRLGVALHPRASRAMLELLSADTDADVAAAARKKLSERRA